MNSILQQWNILKDTWSNKIDKSQSNLFYDFNDFIVNELPFFDKRNHKYIVKKICISNLRVDKISFKNETLYIYDSPFYVTIAGKKYPSGLILKIFLSNVIKYIENNSLSSIKIVTSKFNNDEEEEEKEEDKGKK